MRKRKIIAGIAAVTMAHVPAVSARHRGCPRTISSATSMSSSAVIAEIKEVFGTQWRTALGIAKRESHLHTGAINLNCNGTHDYGIFQLNSGGTLQSLGLSSVTALDAGRNIRAARRLQRARGWQPWSASSGTR